MSIPPRLYQLGTSIAAFILLYVAVSIALLFVPGLGDFGFLGPLLALVFAGYAARRVWLHGAQHQSTILSTAVGGALIVGGIGFIGGFIGPMIFAPGANQGPLLGIFITGPLGCLVGGIGGLIVGATARARRKSLP